MPDQELRMEAKFKGGEEVAGELKKVDEAQKQVGKGTTAQTKAVKQGTEAQQKLNATEGDYTMLLGRVHPLLGVVVEASVKAAKIAGDLATRQIVLRGAMTKVTGAVRANAKALLLVGAGGAVIAGIMGIIATYNRLKESIKRSTEALAASGEAHRAAVKRYDEMAAAIREVADQRERLTKMDIAESEAIQRQAQRDEELMGVPAAVSARVRAKLQGIGASEEQTRQAVLLATVGEEIEFDPGAPAWSRLATLESFVEQPGAPGQVAKAEGRQRDVVRARHRDVIEDLQVKGGTEDVREQLKAFGIAEEHLDKVLEAYRISGATAGGLEGEGVGRNLRGDVIVRNQIGVGGEGLFAGTPLGAGAEAIGLGGVRLSEDLVMEMLRFLKELNEGRRQALENLQPTGGTVIQAAEVHVHPTSASVQQQAITNGQTWADRTGVEGR